jgi:hypothetical protein
MSLGSGGAVLADLALSRLGSAASTREEVQAAGAAGAPNLIGQNAYFPLPRNGRQLARRQDGTWFVTYASYVSTIRDDAREIIYAPGTGIRMSTSLPASPGNLPKFSSDEVLIVNDGAGGYVGRGPNASIPKSVGHVIESPAGGDDGTSPSIVIDAQDILHLVWTRPHTGEVWYGRCDVSGPDGVSAIGRTEAWRHSDGRTAGPEKIGEEGAELGDICLDGNGRSCMVYRNQNGIVFARCGDKWQQEVVAHGNDLKWPTITCDRRGILHLVWTNTSGHVYYLRSTDGGDGWAGTNGKSQDPEFIGGFCWGPPTLAVSGKDIFVAYFEPYRVICYSHFDGRQWSTNTVLSEGSYDHTSPILTVDRHEVVWMHMVTPFNWTRTCRWLGNGWSDLQEGRRLAKMAKVCSAERVMSPTAEEFGVILADTDHRLYFETMQIPVPRAAKGNHIAFLDLWEVAQLRNVEQCVEPMDKDSRNPLLKHGEPGSWDAAETNFQGTILKEGDRYRMWYTGEDIKALLKGWETACGYAESADGVTWTKPDLGLYEYKGSTHNNICFPNGYQFALMRIPEELESDPAKRYRMAFNAGRGSSLAYSPDGIHWTLSPDNPLWGGGRAGEYDSSIAENGIYLYDPHDPDPDRRYKAYPQTVDGLGERTISLMTSPDGIHFTRYPNNPVMDARLSVAKQTHLMELCWRQHGVLIGIYGCYLADDRTDARLAVSRDGINWVRVKDEVPLIPNGAAGAFDAGDVWPSNYPMVEGSDLWIWRRVQFHGKVPREGRWFCENASVQRTERGSHHHSAHSGSR